MKTLRWNWNRWPFALLGLLSGAVPAMAHEKWFVDEATRYFAKPELFTRVTPFGAAVVLLGLGAFLAYHRYEKKEKVSRHPGFLKNLVGDIHVHARVVLSVTLGVMLMGAGLQGTLFSPNLLLPDTTYGHILGWAQISLGSLFIFLTPFFAELGVLLALLFLGGLFAVPFHNYMEELLVLGIAIFFMTSETVRWPWRKWNTLEVERKGYHAMRILVGLNFLVLAMVKWMRPDLAMQVVESNGLNFMAWAGVTSAHFVFCAAVVETLISAAILLKIAMRPAIIVAFSFFMMTIYVLGFTELLGHLPIKSTLFILFLLGDWKPGEMKIVR